LIFDQQLKKIETSGETRQKLKLNQPVKSTGLFNWASYHLLSKPNFEHFFELIARSFPIAQLSARAIEILELWARLYLITQYGASAFHKAQLGGLCIS
jgi:hypothetical protein